jgi:arsenate reductase (glutaredoxin)
MATTSTPVLVYGTDDSTATRAALRFFKERRITVQYHNLRQRRIAAGELRRFAERLGGDAIADKDGPAWRAAGLAWLRMDSGELVERLLLDQRLIRLPLVRAGNEMAAGRDDEAWRRVAAAVGGQPDRRR